MIAAGNFSITAALAKHFALIAAKYLPSWELIDYAHSDKIDAPSGTVRELAEELGKVAIPHVEVPIERIHGTPLARARRSKARKCIQFAYLATSSPLKRCLVCPMSASPSGTTREPAPIPMSPARCLPYGKSCMRQVWYVVWII